MIRITAALALALSFAIDANAQVVIRVNPIAPPARPAGVIPPVSLPIAPGALTTPGVYTPHTRLTQRFVANPYYNYWGYTPYWPGPYETTPLVVNNYVPVPVAVSQPVPPPPPPELRARLKLNVPAGSHVWLGDKEVDSAVTPLVLQSPVLQDGQSYVFDVKVKWQEGKSAEERTRKVSVEAGESKSLTYFR